jgi:hypothetical protein
MDRTIPPSVSDLIARLQSHVPSSAVEQDYVVDAWLAGQEHHPEVMPEWGMDADVTDSVPFTVAGLPDTSGQTPPGVQTFGGDPIHGHDDPAVSGPAEDPGYDPRVTTPSWVLEPVAEEPATAPDPRVTTTVEDLMPADDHAGEEVGIGEFEREQLEGPHVLIPVEDDPSGEIIMIDPIESTPVGEDMPIEEYEDPIVWIDDPAPTGGDMPIEGVVEEGPHNTGVVPPHIVENPHYGEDLPQNTGVVPPHIVEDPHYGEDLPPELILVVEEGETPLGEGVIVDEPEYIDPGFGAEDVDVHADVMPEDYDADELPPELIFVVAETDPEGLDTVVQDTNYDHQYESIFPENEQEIVDDLQHRDPEPTNEDLDVAS